MIIKLQDSDITTAQDSPDDEGVIHVPDAIWNHIIREVEHPEQTFVNSLYIDVKDIEIGGSGLPVVCQFFRIGSLYSGNTYDLSYKPAGQPLSVDVTSGKAWFAINIGEGGTGYNSINYFVNNGSGTSQVNVDGTYACYYYTTPNIVDTNSPKLTFYDENGNSVIELNDLAYTDNKHNKIVLNSGIIDFLWLTP